MDPERSKLLDDAMAKMKVMNGLLHKIKQGFRLTEDIMCNKH